MTVKDVRPIFHARVYHCMIEDSRLSPADLVTAVKIARFADFNSRKAWPGMRKIASIGVKQHVGTVCECVKKLEKLGYLIVERRAGLNGQNLYILTLPQLSLLDRAKVFGSGERRRTPHANTPVRVRRT